jgi:hypothetical protein
MATRIIGTLLTGLLLISCQTKKVDNGEVIVTDSIITTNTKSNLSERPDSVTKDFELDHSDCIRGQAESVIKKTVYPNSNFKINDDKLTGTETVDLGNGEKLIIYNWGCEYYVLTFRFETVRFQADTTDIKYWMDKAVSLMSELEKGLDAPLDIKTGTIATRYFIKGNKNYELRQEIVYDTAVIRDFVTLDRIQKLGDKKYGVEISYGTGPL